MDQKKVWNDLAEPWGNFRSKPIVEVSEFLKDKNGRVLDVGCGSGRNMIKKEGLEYYGIDFSDKMIHLAKKNAEIMGIKARLKRSEASKLDFDNEFFDFVICISTLHCIESAGERKKAIQEIYRVLKEGGEAMVSVWNKEEKASLQDIEGKEGYIKWHKDGIVHKRYYYFYDKEELIYLLEEIGFKVINSELRDSDSKHAKKNIVIYVKK